MEQVIAQDAVVPAWLLKEVLDGENVEYAANAKDVRVSSLPPPVAQALLEHIAAQERESTAPLPLSVKKSRCQAAPSMEATEPKNTRRGLLGSVIRALGVGNHCEAEKSTELSEIAEVQRRPKRKRQRRYTRDEASVVSAVKSFLNPDKETSMMLTYLEKQLSSESGSI